jgi:hypothetical protein
MKYKTNRLQVPEFIQGKENKQLDNQLTNKLIYLWGCLILHISHLDLQLTVFSRRLLVSYYTFKSPIYQLAFCQ